MACAALRLIFLCCFFVLYAEGRSWTISGNAYHNYFNVAGDVASELRAGSAISINGRRLQVAHSVYFGDAKSTYVQVDKDHGANDGATVEAAAEGDEDNEIDDSFDSDVGETAPGPAPRPKAAAAHVPPHGEFGPEMEGIFVSAVSVQDVQDEVRTQAKPGVVFVTQPWCGACKNLKSVLASNGKLRTLLEQNFVVAHVSGDAGKEWQAPGKDDGYIPRVYFLGKDGKMLDVHGPNEKYSHFFSDAASLEEAFRKTLTVVNDDDEL